MPASIEFTDEELMAYADGELSPDRVAALIPQLAFDNALQQRLDRYTRTRAALQSAFSSAVDAPMPARLQAVFDKAAMAPAVERPPAAALQRRRLHRNTVWALAASLVLAIGLVALLISPSMPQDAVVAHAELQPDAKLLDQALEVRASGDPLSASIGPRSEEIMPVSTLRAADGRYCRLFDVNYEQAQTPSRHAKGLACREAKGRWQVLKVIDADAVAVAQPSTDQYATAGAGGPDLQQLLPAAAPLTPQAEAAHISEGWR